METDKGIITPKAPAQRRKYSILHVHNGLDQRKGNKTIERIRLHPSVSKILIFKERE